MSDDGQKRVTRFDVIAKGPSLVTEMFSDALSRYLGDAVGRLRGSQEDGCKAARAGEVIATVAFSYAEAFVTQKIVEVEKLKAETVKLYAEADRIDKEGRKLLAEEDVAKATIAKLQVETMANRLDVMRKLLDMVKECADPVLARVIVEYVTVEAGSLDGAAALAVAIEGQALGRPTGDRTKAVAEGETI